MVYHPNAVVILQYSLKNQTCKQSEMRPKTKKPEQKGMLYTELQYQFLPSLAPHTVHPIHEGRELLLPKYWAAVCCLKVST